MPAPDILTVSMSDGGIRLERKQSGNRWNITVGSRLILSRLSLLLPIKTILAAAAKTAEPAAASALAHFKYPKLSVEFQIVEFQRHASSD